MGQKVRPSLKTSDSNMMINETSVSQEHRNVRMNSLWSEPDKCNLQVDCKVW